MNRNWQINNIFCFLLTLLLMFGSLAAPVHAALESGTWQEPESSTGIINGTPPTADGAAVPVYQGSTRLDLANAPYTVQFSAMPRDFSADNTPAAMQPINPADIEGDVLAVPPFRWEGGEPSASLIWADAATPDEPLNPQPVPNQTFCAQNMAGRQLVVWSQVDTEAQETPPALYLLTATGVPSTNPVPLLEQKIAINIAPAVGDPIAVTADNFDETLGAVKVKAGEPITLHIVTRGCDGNAFPNSPFIITRKDAQNRQGAVNNSKPVHVGDTELTTTTTEFHGTSDGRGEATVTVTQDQGPGVKTVLQVSSANFPALKAEIPVIFTTLTSPDVPEANMWGHMAETSTAEISGETYTFTRPALKAEAPDSEGSINSNNETWARFQWDSADSYCDIMPDVNQLKALKTARGDLVPTIGWPVSGTGYYRSSTVAPAPFYHFGYNMRDDNIVSIRDNENVIVSCVDKAMPVVTPAIQLVLSGMDEAHNAAIAQVGEEITMTVILTDSVTGERLPFYAFDLYMDEEKNHQGQTRSEAYAENSAFAWRDNVVSANLAGAGVPGHYTGVTGENGRMVITLKQPDGAGVLTPLRVVASDVEATANVVFTVPTSPQPDVEGARMWGHMDGSVMAAGQLFKRPMLASEAGSETGSTIENRETWATFNSLDAGLAQCGTGQVPSQLSLNALYSTHSGNTMETEKGWPTGSHSYLTADVIDAQTKNVNLETGADGSFTSEPNYLSCSANEVVSHIDAYFFDDPTILGAVAKVGEKIKMNVKSTNIITDVPLPGVRFTVKITNIINRDGGSTGFDDPSGGVLTIDGAEYGINTTLTYEGITDANGNAEVMMTQPRGVGLKTLFDVAPQNSMVSTPANRSVTFTVPTSPDSPKAKMWGHMPDTLTVDGMTFERPKLAEEVGAHDRTYKEANEIWVRVLQADADGNPGAGGCAANRLPRIDQLQALYGAYSGGAINSAQGWPVAKAYWSSSFANANNWKQINLGSGEEKTGSAGEDGSDYVSCLDRDNPAAASITIEPVDTSLWYDNGGVHAVKVKKGDTLQLKVTVKDAAGNPLPSAPFVLSRGNGYNRQNDEYQAGSGDAITSPVVIDGESLNDTASQIGGITGSDGSKIINVTRPDALGTRTAIIAAIYHNAAIPSASIDTIFTVATSPDVSVAKMWGHMTESLTAGNGRVIQRPRLLDELSQKENTSSTTEDNETWARFYGPHAPKQNPNNCAQGYYPSRDDLTSLYDAYPGRMIKDVHGWPVNRSYWTGSLPPAVAPTANSLYIVDLDDGGLSTASNGSANNMQYQVCASSAAPLGALITLQAADIGGQTVKVKRDEAAKVVVTLRDAAGAPMPYTGFALTRVSDTARDESYPSSSWGGAKMMYVASAGQTSPIELGTYANAQVVSSTGADGTQTLTLGEPDSPGIKTTLKATMVGQETLASEPLEAIFTVITSPDSDKARMWGHMPETATANNGTVFKRPLLYTELASAQSEDTPPYSESNENWYRLKRSGLDADAGACPTLQMPARADLESLYDAHPNQAIVPDLGWPTSASWWAGDKMLSGSSFSWQYVNIKNNYWKSATSSAELYVQLCLTKPRIAAGSLTLTLTGQDEATGIAKVKKGETIAATVQVKDTAGQPMKNVLVKLSRDPSMRRTGGSYTPSSSVADSDDITLSNFSPSAQPTFVMATTADSVNVYTDDQGMLTFTVSQDASAGLSTVINAKVMDGRSPSVKDSKTAIFTVVTSPDTPKAKMWGHMPETFTNSDGVVFKRPLLRSELSSTSNASARSVVNEEWYTWDRYSRVKEDNSPCDVLGMPTASQLKTLYNDYPGGEIATAFGLPLNFVWAAGDLTIPDGKPVVSSTSTYYQYVNLEDGTIQPRTTNTLVTTMQLCLATPRSLVVRQAADDHWDAQYDAARAKVKESIAVTATVTDDAGTPLPGTVVQLYRYTSTQRDNRENTLSSQSGMVVQSEGVSLSWVMKSFWWGITGADGQVHYTVNQDGSTGLKTKLQASPADKTTFEGGEVDVIYTVLTSPDTDKASMWGHMAETVTTSGGIVFRRPLLTAEVSGNNNTGYPMVNELWSSVNQEQLSMPGASGCDGEKQPTYSALQDLYDDDDKKDGGLFTNYGWPVKEGSSGVSAYWLASDPDPATHYAQSIYLLDGTKHTASSQTALYRQACLR